VADDQNERCQEVNLCPEPEALGTSDPFLSPATDLTPALGLIDQLVAARKISRDFGNFLKAQVREAQAQLNRGNTHAAVMWLRVMVGELDMLVRFCKLTQADAAPLRTLFTQVIDAQPARVYYRFGHWRRH
jgi:hypothetical protein